MRTALAALAILGGGLASEPSPPPLELRAKGGSAHMTCGLVSVEIRWLVRPHEGVLDLNGEMGQSGARRPLEEPLTRIWSGIHEISTVQQRCALNAGGSREGDVGVRSVITAWPKDRQDLKRVEYVVTVHEGFVVEVTGPSEPFE